ncbi:O-methyltransferase [Raineya orbicola]|jgi:predicted O-methyltransferase YrrM|uniref:Methyltransferase domain n=1 Tax=Raineya orbicola TaxID=2016530 RepID=A0A2N3IAB8_9BACT|nr:class I SAM-dependent methyltransferase [Raineya orbicola]PKQ67239.1 Methyltransferase domain [Raineya orbicola]
MKTAIKAYWKYFWNAKNEHSLHSPFVYELYTQVIKHQEFDFYAYQEIEKFRELLLDNDEIIEIQDLGAGSKAGKSQKKSIRNIVATASLPARVAQMLFRLVNFLQPQIVLDLGTSLGITTAYLAKAMPLQAKIYTFEGAENLAQLAQKHFKMLHLQNIEVIKGNIDETLPKVLSQIEKVDFAFVDANHLYEPTIRYFEEILTKCHENSVIVFDDIYWSEEMKAAWEKIYADTRVGISIDLFRVGLVFLRQKQEKQHFILRF